MDSSQTTDAHLAGDDRRSSPPPKTYAYGVSVGILCVIFLVGFVGLWRRPIRLDDMAAPADDTIAQTDPRLDPNRAPWQDLAQLPGLGEIKSKAIVRYREAARGGVPAARSQPFRTADDLQAVRGIGPKTVEKLRPHLRFPPLESPPVIP